MNLIFIRTEKFKMNSFRLLLFLAIMILLVDLAYLYPRLTGRIVRYEPETAIVTKVLDGDTLEADNQTRVRLLCINAPERGRAFYEEAKRELEKLENKEVDLLRDKEDKDRYNRTLRYVFYGSSSINKKLLEKGLAHVYLCEDLRFEKELRKEEQEAREDGKGIWKKSSSKCAGCIELLELNPEEEFFILKNDCEHSCSLEGKDEANHFFKIELEGREEKRIESKGNVWNNEGDSLFLRDEDGLVLYYSYSK